MRIHPCWSFSIDPGAKPMQKLYSAGQEPPPFRSRRMSRRCCAGRRHVHVINERHQRGPGVRRGDLGSLRLDRVAMTWGDSGTRPPAGRRCPAKGAAVARATRGRWLPRYDSERFRFVSVNCYISRREPRIRRRGSPHPTAGAAHGARHRAGHRCRCLDGQRLASPLPRPTRPAGRAAGRALRAGRAARDRARGRLRAGVAQPPAGGARASKADRGDRRRGLRGCLADRRGPRSTDVQLAAAAELSAAREQRKTKGRLWL